MKKTVYTAPTVKVVRLKTMTKLMTTSSIKLGGSYDGEAEIQDRDDEDSFGW